MKVFRESRGLFKTGIRADVPRHNNAQSIIQNWWSVIPIKRKARHYSKYLLETFLSTSVVKNWMLVKFVFALHNSRRFPTSSISWWTLRRGRKPQIRSEISSKILLYITWIKPFKILFVLKRGAVAFHACRCSLKQVKFTELLGRTEKRANFSSYSGLKRALERSARIFQRR